MTAYDAIFEGITRNLHTVIFIQLYTGFFAENTPWCDSQSMSIIPGYKPALDQPLRRKLNRLAEEVRDRMKGIIETYHQNHIDRKMYFIDEFDHSTYTGHRFC